MNKNAIDDQPFAFRDELGPARVIHVHEPSLQLQATLVIDNVAAGPAIGGLRMAPDVTTLECARLARAMTLKNAAAGLRHGGGKSVLRADPRMDPQRKQELVRAFAHALRNESDYIFGPDMGTDETAMAWVLDEIGRGRAVGLPVELGGIPLDELGATGWGVAHAAEIAAPHCGLAMNGLKVAIQGFGAVGRHAARFLRDRGAVLVAVADSVCTLHDPRGIDLDHLLAIKESGGHVGDAKTGQRLDADAIIGIECDSWIPAARPDVVRADNVAQLKARLVIQGANIPFTDEAERLLAQRKVTVVPDFIANAGGVICAAMELAGATRAAAFDAIAERIRANTDAVLQAAAREQISPRDAANALAVSRVRSAMSHRRFGVA